MARVDTEFIDFDGHRVAYRVIGQGPALVVLHLYRRREDNVRARLVSDRCQVFQIAPLGYGYSDRVPGYAGKALADQILAVLDRHGVDRFVVWGYSAAGAMAACIARATSRVAGLVCGGFAPLDFPTPGVLRQLDRRLASDDASRSLWWWFKTFDWTAELSAMSCPRLLYWGSEDRQMAKRLRRTREHLLLQDVDFIEFAGLDHGAFKGDVQENTVVPTVADWISQRVGASW
jgi:pimeloyl-ACP methyl ester carboxylesterase